MRRITIVLIILTSLLVMGCVKNNRSEELCGLLQESAANNESINIEYRNSNCVIWEDGFDTVWNLRCESYTQSAYFVFKFIGNETDTSMFYDFKDDMSSLVTTCKIIKLRESEKTRE